MTLNQAFAIRVREVLKSKHITQSKLEELTKIKHGTMSSILNTRTKASNFKTMAIIIRVLGLSFNEFFKSNVYNLDEIEID